MARAPATIPTITRPDTSAAAFRCRRITRTLRPDSRLVLSMLAAGGCARGRNDFSKNPQGGFTGLDRYEIERDHRDPIVDRPWYALGDDGRLAARGDVAECPHDPLAYLLVA